MTSPAYEYLCTQFRRVALLAETSAMLTWDAATMMPPGGAAARGEQLAELAGLSHEILTAPKVAESLAAAEAMPPENPWHAANLKLMRHAYNRAAALPRDLVEAQARANSACEKVWRTARKEADFALVRPHFEEVLRLTREAAAALSASLGLSPYDALMDGHQRGIGAAEVRPLFAQLEAFLRDAIREAEARQAQTAPPLSPAGPFPIPVQEALCRELAEQLGLDFTHARFDRSLHPFCGGIPSDVRITTRYEEADFSQALQAVLHEVGHALYEQNLPRDFARLPVGEAAGMAVHESQSLIIEMQAGRSDAFLGWLGPRLHAAFGGDAAVYAAENLARLWRRVSRGFIRVDADELTYPLHVILRFRLEEALIAGQLAVADLPAAWNEGMHSLLGITPPNDALGCLQDIHWYDGSFGYFPSYTLGAMAAAQLMAAVRAAVPELDVALAEGDFSPLLRWLREHVHSKGSLYSFHELLRQATGRPLETAAFEQHLKARYLGDR
ncbi:MAG: carboxypeptidase M32 [Acetobacteraceae bacterium]|nr:carboxypeptidase M32 [Acetobacteraceae bacterium]